MTSDLFRRTVVSMSGGGRSISLPPASWPALTLQLAAVLSGLLAALCWFGASISHVQLAGGSTGSDLRWWSASVAVAGIGVALLSWFAATVRGRVGALVVVVMIVGLGVSAFLFFRFVVPTANPIHPLGAAVPYALAGFVTAGLACLLAAGSIAVSGRNAVSSQPRSTIGRRTAVVAGCMALLLVAGAGLVVVDRSRDYLLRANEYRTLGDVDGAPAGVPASTLSGGVRWRIDVPGLSLTQPALTDYGIGLASGQNVIMVDRATGGIRWRYTRSDESGQVSVARTGGGRQVLVRWGSGVVYILDARTGERVGQWSGTAEDTEILDPALPVVARIGSDHRTTIARVNSVGDDEWTYGLLVCERARATLAEAVVVVTTVTTCGGPSSSRVVALDAATGVERWSAVNSGDVRGVVAGAALLVTPSAGEATDRSLTAIDLDSGITLWSHEVPRMGTPDLPCEDLQVQAGAQLAAAVCTFDLTDYPIGAEDYSSVVHTYDAAGGSILRTASFRPAPVISTAVSTDGRVIVARADPVQGWVLEVVAPAASAAHNCGSRPTKATTRRSGPCQCSATRFSSSTRGKRPFAAFVDRVSGSGDVS